jgi:GntR family transcriptional regulator
VCSSDLVADERKAEVLDVEIGTPLLQIDRIAFSIDERPVEWRRSHCNTAYNHYQNTLR